MRLWNRAVLLGTLLVCSASPRAASADTALYDASLIVHAFVGGIPMPIGASAQGAGTISVSATGSGPAAVALPHSALRVTTAAFWPIASPTTFYSTYATFVNQAGRFFAGGGPAAGKGIVSHKGNADRVGSWFIHEGKNAFGGTLGLLGKQGAFAQFRITSVGPSGPVPGIFTGTSSWNMIRALGRSAMDSLNPYTNTGMFVNKSGRSDPYSLLVTTYKKLGSGTPWTTGTVTVVAKEGSYATSLRRTGYDTTTPGGARNIQLVTPTLTHWARGHGRPDNHTGHIAILKIRLVPEPTGVVMIAAGGCALALLYGRLHSSSFRRDPAP
jgi:hypothetical protein